jgi:hypothetical protein
MTLCSRFQACRRRMASRRVIRDSFVSAWPSGPQKTRAGRIAAATYPEKEGLANEDLNPATL